MPKQQKDEVKPPVPARVEAQISAQKAEIARLLFYARCEFEAKSAQYSKNKLLVKLLAEEYRSMNELMKTAKLEEDSAPESANDKYGTIRKTLGNIIRSLRSLDEKMNKETGKTILQALRRIEEVLTEINAKHDEFFKPRKHLH
ncbi:MAG: hypothetical protein OXC72_05115 [Roseovarius sp.]|nr:hypothetical protein [Roseovarius sp.]MCY4291122.1 hypothetical protein [Roseovarius sp.]